MTDTAARLRDLEARIVDLEARLLKQERHTHNTSPSHHATGRPVAGSVR
jgi:BMFP domain-containing protein YqiC